MRRNYGYGSYHGRGGFRTFLKVVIAILAVVLVVLVAGYFFLQQYAVVTDEGVRFEIPFFRSETPSPSPSDPIVIETPPVMITPTPTPEPELTLFYERMALTDAEVLKRGDDAKGYFYDLEAQGELANGLFTLKGADGLLGYVSKLPLAKDMRTSSADLTLNTGAQSVNDINAGVMYHGAYISCFRDDSAPYHRNSLALRSGGGNWRDALNTRWMSPASTDARDYVVGVCKEAMSLGFRSLVLDYAAFPADDGRLGQITKGEAYDSAAFETTVSGFYAQVREAIDLGGGWPTDGALKPKLCIVTDKLTLDEGRNPSTGQTLETLLKYADRIYVDLEGAEAAPYYEKLKGLGMTRPEENLVLLVQEAPVDEVPYSWAVLPFS